MKRVNHTIVELNCNSLQKIYNLYYRFIRVALIHNDLIISRTTLNKKTLITIKYIHYNKYFVHVNWCYSENKNGPMCSANQYFSLIGYKWKRTNRSLLPFGCSMMGYRFHWELACQQSYMWLKCIANHNSWQLYKTRVVLHQMEKCASIMIN